MVTYSNILAWKIQGQRSLVGHSPWGWEECDLTEQLSIIVHHIYVSQLLYPFTCGWTSRLLPCSSYYKQCCNEHWGIYVFFDFDFLRVYAQEWDCWVIRWFYSWFFRESPYHLPQWLYQFTFLLAMQEGPLFSTPSPAFIACRLFDDGHSDQYVFFLSF